MLSVKCCGANVHTMEYKIDECCFVFFWGGGGEEEEFKCVQVFGYVKLDLLFLSNASKVAKGKFFNTFVDLFVLFHEIRKVTR